MLNTDRRPSAHGSLQARDSQTAADFYRNVDRGLYGTAAVPESHDCADVVAAFVQRYGLSAKRCLEIGSGRGVFQDAVPDYTGVDVSEDLRKFYRKPFHVVNDARLPFPDSSFDAVFACRVHEHIPDIELAFVELVRVLRAGGVCLLAPAWHTRPWFAEGLSVRPWRDLDARQRVLKALIPVRDSRLVRWPAAFSRRCAHLGVFLLSKRAARPLYHRRLATNYREFWQSDSDACNSLDPFDVYCWFLCRGFTCPTRSSAFSMLFSRDLALEFCKTSARRDSGTL
jgi:SAM-dependent methyltransferase